MIRFLLIALTTSLLGGCGILYTDVKVPRAYRTAVQSEVKASADDPIVNGRACFRSLLYLVAWGDAGYEAAAKDALKDQPGRMLYDVKTDVRQRSVLVGLYSQSCTYLIGRAAKP